jgi:hypothetical protein
MQVLEKLLKQIWEWGHNSGDKDSCFLFHANASAHSAVIGKCFLFSHGMVEMATHLVHLTLCQLTFLFSPSENPP